MQTAEIFNELVVLTEGKLRNFLLLRLLKAANNNERERRFHSFAAKTHICAFITLNCAFTLEF